MDMTSALDAIEKNIKILEESSAFFEASFAHGILSASLLPLGDLPSARRHLCLAGSNMLRICEANVRAGTNTQYTPEYLKIARGFFGQAHETSVLLLLRQGRNAR